MDNKIEEPEKKQNCRNENPFIVVPDSMLSLGLRGSKLLVYAVIFSFTKNSIGFTGTAAGLANRIHRDKRTIERDLRSLKNDGFIKQENGVYSAVIPPPKATNLSHDKGVAISDKSVAHAATKTSPDTIYSKESLKTKHSKVFADKKTPETDIPERTIENILEYFKRKGFASSPDSFYHYNEAKGWKGVVDWRPLADLWEANNKGGGSNQNESGTSRSYNIDAAVEKAKHLDPTKTKRRGASS